MTRDTCNQVDLLAFLHGQLSETDYQQTYRHLQSCANCQNELELLQDGVSLVFGGLNSVEPPPSVRNEVFQKAYELRGPMDDERVLTEHVSNLRHHSDVPAIRQSVRRSRRPFPRPINLVTSVAAVLALVCTGLTFQVISGQHKIHRLQQELDSSQTKTVSLHAASTSYTAAGEAVIVRGAHRLRLIVYVTNMQPTQGTQVYHIWLWNHGKRLSAGIMTVGSTGVATFTQTLTTTQLDGIGITLEPNPHTRVPVGPKVLGAQNIGLT